MDENRINEELDYDAFAENLLAMGCPEEFQAALKKENIHMSMDEMSQFFLQLADAIDGDGELSLAQLDEVAGGRNVVTDIGTQALARAVVHQSRRAAKR